MYKNGVLYETQTGVMVSGTTGTSLGLARIALLKAYGDPGTTNYVGKLANVSIWDRVLTNEEHAQLAASAGFH